MSGITITDLNYAYDGVPILSDISLSIDKGEFFFLLGPSGCGKTTLLRTIAGLGPAPLSGSISLFGRTVDQLPPWRRETPLVFQNYALWPHMTVFENVAFGLRMRKAPDVKQRVEIALETVQLAAHSAKRPAELSGGQQQRVALARAMVLSPELLLLDEPLSNLDAALRLEMRYELKRIHDETGITFIYVTHDQEEALSLATNIALLDRGRIVQTGTPVELYHRPTSLFSATFMGAANRIEGTVEARRVDGGLTVESDIGRLEAVTVPGDQPREGDPVVVIIRPEALTPDPQGTLSGIVKNRYFLGPASELTVECQGIPLKVMAGGSGAGGAPGDTITLRLSPQAAMAYPRELP